MDGTKGDSSDIVIFFLRILHIRLTAVYFNCNIFFSWDEYVPESRVLKLNEASLQKQKELKRDFKWVLLLLHFLYSDRMSIWFQLKEETKE